MKALTCLRPWSSLLLCALAGLGLGAHRLPAADDERSDNERYTTEAWDALKARKYDEAIERAGKCVEKFQRDAETMQAKLKNATPPTPPPKTGKEMSEAEKKAIIERGTLNDVASCYFIQGEAHSALAKKADSEKEKKKETRAAKEAYEKASKLTYARTFDPRYGGFFWDPATTANDRIADLPAVRDD